MYDSRMSENLNDMVEYGYGYRNQAYRGSGYTLLKDVLDFEINELENEDILITMDKLYNNYKDEYENKDGDMVRNIVNYICSAFGCGENELHCVWLTTKNAIGFYCEPDTDADIRKVHIHDNKMIPISDLGYEGALFAYVSEDGSYEYENYNMKFAS